MKLNPKNLLFGDDSRKKGPVLLAVTPPKPIPRWDVHFGGIDDDRKDATALQHLLEQPHTDQLAPDDPRNFFYVPQQAGDKEQ